MYAFKKAAEQDTADTQLKLGIRYYNGDGVVQNYVQAAKWFTKTAQQGHAEAQLLLDINY